MLAEDTLDVEPALMPARFRVSIPDYSLYS